jgi:hypothetical protein
MDTDAYVKEQLALAYPSSTFPMTIRCVRDGIILADEYLSSTAFMLTPVGLDLRGNLRRAAISFKIHELCTKGDLPFSTTMPKMERANWHQLEIRSGKCVGYLTRTEEEGGFPEDRPSRQDERLRNQGDLFQPNVVALNESALNISAWLTWRADRKGNLLHLCWGAPAADVDEWLGFSNLLKTAAHDLPVVTSSADMTSPDPKERMRFREEVAEKLNRRNDDDDAANDNK